MTERESRASEKFCWRQRERGRRLCPYLAGMGFLPYKLGLPVTWTHRRSWRKLLRRFHPDKQKESVFMDKMGEATAAGAARFKPVDNVNGASLLCKSCLHSNSPVCKHTRHAGGQETQHVQTQVIKSR